MTTERPTPRITLSGLEWRLLLTTGLATTYVVAWLAFGTTLPSKTVPRSASRASPSEGAAPASSVWFTDLPPADRPEVRLPVGWILASPPTGAPAPRLVRVPGRAARVRTRSS